MLKKVVSTIGRLIKGVFSMAFTFMLIGIALYVYARYIEPELLSVQEKRLATNSIKIEGAPLRIIQFSDVHLGQDFSTSHLQKIVDKINSLEPDFIVFTGDLIEDNKSFDKEEETISTLNQLQATYGKYAVYGNHDHGGNGTRRYAKIMKQSGFHLLVNEQIKVELANGEVVNIIGIDDVVLSKIDIPGAMEGINKAHYNIFLSHAPDVVEQVKAYPIDLQLSGHSHGGQVRIPFIGAPFTPPYGQKYVKGSYAFEDQKRLTLYVNVGIGTSQMRYRFGNIPELTLFLISN